MKIHTLLQSIVTDVVVDPLYHIGYPIEGNHEPKEFCKYYLDQSPFLILKSKIKTMIETNDTSLHYLDLNNSYWARNHQFYNAVVACIDNQWYLIPVNQINQYQSIKYKGIQA